MKSSGQGKMHSCQISSERDSELLKIVKEIEDIMEQNMLQKADAFGYQYKEH